jgi:hypothetical protein
MMPLDGVAPESTGSTALRAYGGVPFGSTEAFGAGGGLRVGHQFTPNLSASLDGAAVGDFSRNVNVAVRGSARWTLDNQKLAFVVGLGSETLAGPDVGNSVIGYGHTPIALGTADAAVRAGTFVTSSLEIYGQAGIAAVFGREAGSGIGYVVAGAGLQWRLPDSIRLSANLDAAPVFLSGSGAKGEAWFLPSVSLGYVFGDQATPRTR